MHLKDLSCVKHSFVEVQRQGRTDPFFPAGVVIWETHRWWICHTRSISLWKEYWVCSCVHMVIVVGLGRNIRTYWRKIRKNCRAFLLINLIVQLYLTDLRGVDTLLLIERPALSERFISPLKTACVFFLLIHLAYSSYSKSLYHVRLYWRPPIGVRIAILHQATICLVQHLAFKTCQDVSEEIPENPSGTEIIE